MISTRGRYAVRVMSDLAEFDNGSYIPLKDIASREGISKKYLEIIVKDLVKGGLISGASGKGGGYRLCRKPDEYSVGEIIELMEGSLATVACLTDGAAPCPRAAGCRTLPLWEGLDSVVDGYLSRFTLQDLADGAVAAPAETEV